MTKVSDMWISNNEKSSHSFIHPGGIRVLDGCGLDKTPAIMCVIPDETRVVSRLNQDLFLFIKISSQVTQRTSLR